MRRPLKRTAPGEGRVTEYTITEEEFQEISSLIYQESGIALSGGKKSMLISRLSRRLRELGLDRFHDYYRYITSDNRDEEFTRLLDLVSTNKTDFFREQKHFEFMREVILPELAETKRVRIWSAGCSSGEESYSIAMVLSDWIAHKGRWDCKILASDLSTRVLRKADDGIYELEKVKGLDPKQIRRHFLRGRGENTGQIKVKPHLRKMIAFKRINLMAEHFPIKTPLDLIFCRNVMIYFDRPTQAQLVAKFHHHLKPGGHLFIGHSESLHWVESQFRYVAPTIYRKEG